MKHLNKWTAFGIATLCFALILVLTGAGCNCRVGNNTTESIRPANEASEEGSAEEAAATPTPTATPIPTPTPTPTARTCTFVRPEATAQGTIQEILLKYFQALQKEEFATAYGYLDAASQQKYGSELKYKQQMERSFECIRVTSFTNLEDKAKCPMVSASLGIQCYTVGLEALDASWNPTTNPSISKEYQVHSDPHGDKSTAPEGQITEL